MSLIEEGTFNNLRVTSIKTEIKWEVALKLLTEFDSKTSLTKITKPEGGDVYIFFSTKEDDEKELTTVDKWQWYNNKNKSPFPSKTNIQIYKTYFDSRNYNATTGAKTNSSEWRKRLYQPPDKHKPVLVHYLGDPNKVVIGPHLNSKDINARIS